MSTWSAVLQLVADHKISVADGEKLILAIIALSNGIVTGKTNDPLALLKQEAPHVFPLIEFIAEIFFPEIVLPVKAGIVVAQLLLAVEGLTPVQRQAIWLLIPENIRNKFQASTANQEWDAWMNRQNAT